MACSHTLRLKNPRFSQNNPKTVQEMAEYIEVPCGVCINCRIKKRMELETFIKAEYQEKQKGVFVTLTYTDDYLEQKGLNRMNEQFYEKQKIPYSLCKKDAADFFKRLKINGKRSKLVDRISYVYCGEYGSEENRPHLHALIFGIDTKLSGLIKQSWMIKYKLNGIEKRNPIGLIDIKDIQPGAIRYILKYMDFTPKGEKQKAEWEKLGLEPPFVKHSPKMGQSIFEKNADLIQKEGKIRTGDGEKKVMLPKYWRTKLGIWKPIKLEEIREKMNQEGIKDTSIKNIKRYQQYQAELKEENELIKLNREKKSANIQFL